MERHLLRPYLLEKFGCTYLVNVFSVLILFVMKHFESQYGQHEELLFRVSLRIIIARSHRHSRSHQFLSQHLRLVFVVEQVWVVNLFRHFRVGSWFLINLIIFVFTDFNLQIVSFGSHELRSSSYSIRSIVFRVPPQLHVFWYVVEFLDHGFLAGAVVGLVIATL